MRKDVDSPEFILGAESQSLDNFDQIQRMKYDSRGEDIEQNDEEDNKVHKKTNLSLIEVVSGSRCRVNTCSTVPLCDIPDGST